MANYKLTNDYWETSGIYDIGQGKTQREINAELKASAESTIKPETVSGGVATFEGGEGVPLKSLVVNIEPAQAGSGDPSPTNVRPITGWTGANVTRTKKNLLDKNALQTGAIDADGNEVTNNGAKRSGFIPVVEDYVTYTNTYAGDTNVTVFSLYDANKAFIRRELSANGVVGNPVVFTFSTTGVSYVRFSVAYNNIKESASNLQLELGSTATTYEPYQGDTYTITFPSEAGTVYGGTLDVTNGVLTVTDANIESYDGETLQSTWISDRDVYAAGTTPTTGAQVVYKLSTPITYTLTPTEVKALLGTNNVWADCGDVDVEYGAYLTVVENQLDEKIPKVAVAPIEKTTTASKAYSVNEMFFMGDKLYIATASIASGATFTVGTNCAETTIGEILTTLLNA